MSRNYKPVSHQLTRNIYQKAAEGYSHSKTVARAANGGKSPLVHSTVTAEKYANICKNYGKWVEKTYKVHGDMDAALSHVGEWLVSQENNGTRMTYAAALEKGFGCDRAAFGKVNYGKRALKNITRGRNLSKNQESWQRNHAEVAEALRCCGLRRSEAQALRGADVFERGGEWYVHVSRGKGGKSRDSHIYSTAGDSSGLDWLRAQATAAGALGRVFGAVQGLQYANVHSCRADYAARMYQRYTVAGAGTGKLYKPRDGSDRVYDRGVLNAVSHELGHGDGRFSTVVYNYLSYGKID